jgi:hypothetical protein
MKERPILFSGEMVRAILEGRKTMTRRVIKSNRNYGDFLLIEQTDKTFWPYHSIDGESFDATGNGDEIPIACPYGQPGDRLWVRETCFIHNPPNDRDPHGTVYYSADIGLGGKESKPTPSIFMPRWASRILLEVTGIRVERVQDIGEQDAKAEGVYPEFECDDFAAFMEKRFDPAKESTYRLGFKHVWNKINAKRGYGWDTNPWVWVVRFKRLDEGLIL